MFYSVTGSLMLTCHLLQGGRLGLGTRLLLELDNWLQANTTIDKCSACQKVVAIATRCSERQGARRFFPYHQITFFCFYKPKRGKMDRLEATEKKQMREMSHQLGRNGLKGLSHPFEFCQKWYCWKEQKWRRTVDGF